MNNAKRRRMAKEAAKAKRQGNHHGSPLPNDLHNVYRLLRLWRRGNRQERRS